MLIVTILIPIILVAVFNYFSIYLVKKENSKLLEENDINTNIKNIKSLLERIEENYYYSTDIKKIYSLTGLFVYIISSGYLLYVSTKNLNNNVKDIISYLLLILLLILITIIPFLLLRLLYFSIASKIWAFPFNKNKGLIDIKLELDKNLKELKEEKKKIEKEEKEKIKQEQAERERIQKEQNIIKSKEFYEEATKSDEIEETLMKKAADLKHPEACLYLGKKLMENYSSDKFTKKEKSVIIKDAKNYLYNAKNLNTEANFLYINSCVLSEAKDIDEWKFTLKELRWIEKSGTLPEIYADACSTTISIVVDTIDNLETKIEKKKNPTIKRCYCKFFNAGICGRESNSTITYHCNYHDNPAACITARTYKGIVYEFDD